MSTFTLYRTPFVLRPLLVAAMMLSALLVAQSLPHLTSKHLPTNAHLGQQPLAFMPNVGQADPQVQMQVVGLDGTLSFLPREVALALPPLDGGDPQVVHVQFEGAATPQVIGKEPLAERMNLFVGRDSTNWRTGVPTYAALTYHGLYAGIDLHYDGHAGQLKGTYTVAPGVDPSQIRWRYQGASGVQIDTSTGALQIALADGRTLTEQAPVVWQNAPDGKQLPVPARYTLEAGLVGFSLGSYNPALPLVIDPTLVYSTFLGGSELDYGADIAVDGQGNVYVVGDTASLNFPLQNSLLEPDERGTDVFVTKLDPSGQRIFSTYLGGVGSDYGLGVAIDSQGNAYITGATTSADFPLLNPIRNEVGGNTDAFVTMLRATDNTIGFSTLFGGSGDENGLLLTSVNPGGIAVDGQGNVFITGLTNSADLPATGSAQPVFGGKTDAFVAKLNLASARVVYATYLGGSDDEHGTEIALDSAGHAYVTGSTLSTDFPVRNAIQPENGRAGNDDAFVTKLSADGTSYVYSTYLGGNGNEEGSGIAVDNQGAAYLTGFTINSTNFPAVGHIRGLTDDGNGYLVKLAPSGQQFVYSTRFGGKGSTNSFDIALGPDKSVYLTGITESTTFPTINGLQTTISGPSDAFVTRINAGGCRLVASTFYGGSSFDNAEASSGALAVDQMGNVYITGSTTSSDLRTVNSQQPAYAGKTDGFVAKLTLDGPTGCYDTFLPMMTR